MPLTLLLDFDDTLADSTEGRLSAIRDAYLVCTGAGIAPERITEALVARSNIEGIMDFLAPAPGLAPRMVRAFRDRYYAETAPPPRLYPGMRETLARLQHSGAVLALVTSRHRDLRENGLSWGVAGQLARIGIAGLFPVVVGYEDTVEHKPHPAPFLKALERLGLAPEHAIAVGDSPLDIRAARDAGLRAAAALWGAVRPDALVAERPDFLLQRPEDLLSLAVHSE